jgi:hypothetical protein
MPDEPQNAEADAMRCWGFIAYVFLFVSVPVDWVFDEVILYEY